MLDAAEFGSDAPLEALTFVRFLSLASDSRRFLILVLRSRTALVSENSVLTKAAGILSIGYAYSGSL